MFSQKIFILPVLAIQISLCKVAGKYRNTLVSETFLNYQKGISPMNVFIILQLSRSVRLHRESFLGEHINYKSRISSGCAREGDFHEYKKNPTN